MSTKRMRYQGNRNLQAAVLFGALLALLHPATTLSTHAQEKDGKQAGPIFILDEGWFAMRRYECWDVASIWQAVPEKLKPHTWIVLYVAPEQIYSRSGPNTGKADITPRPDPDYPKKDAALEKALSHADANGIGVVLMVRRWAKSRAAAPSYQRIDEALAKHACIRGLLFSELGCYQFTDVDKKHLLQFSKIAKKHGRKVFWAVFLSGKLKLWNFLIANPEWRSFLLEYRNTIVPTWKNVEPFDCMLNWAECVGLWLTDVSEDWGFMFDPWYWPNSFCVKRGSWRESFWPKVYPKGWPGATLAGCPPYLVKDSMILAALTGCRYFQYERFAFGSRPLSGGSLRPVRDKTASFIINRKLWRSREQVRRLVKVAIEAPRRHEDVITKGYSHSYPKFGPNILWKNVFNIPNGGLDLIPNEGRHYIVPVIPPGAEAAKAFPRVLKPEEVAQPELLRSVLAEYYPQRFTASDPNVLVFDAGDVVYITDSREENRTTLEFTLESKVEADYRCTILVQDATPCDVEVATEELPGGWRKKFILFAGCSVLMEQKDRK